MINPKNESHDPESSKSPSAGMRSSKPRAARLPQGTPVEDLLKLSGLFPKEDADEMMAAIEEGCERIDESGW